MKKAFEALFICLIIILGFLFFTLIVLGKINSPHIHKVAIIGLMVGGLCHLLLSVGEVCLKGDDKNEKK